MTTPLIDDLEKLAQDTPIDRLPKLIGTLSGSLALAQFRMRHEETAKGAPAKVETANEPDRYLTAQEVANQYGLTEKWVWRNKKRLGMPHIQPTTKGLRFPAKSLEKWFQKHRKGAS